MEKTSRAVKGGAALPKETESESAMLTCVDPTHPPRERILEAATDLFYRQGIRAVGVDAIAKAAGTNKMTLYHHFASKDELVAEYLRRLLVDAERGWFEIESAYPDNPKARIRAHLDRVEAVVTQPTDFGRAFVNAYIELQQPDHPARPIIREHEVKVLKRLGKLFAEAGLSEPERLADEVYLLIEGARIAIQCEGPNGPATRIVTVLESIIADHVPNARRRRAKTVRTPSSVKNQPWTTDNIFALPDAKSPPKERILAAASELFYRHSIRAVSVDAVAKAAGTNKMTLYHHFASKDDLIADYVRRMAEFGETSWLQTEKDFPDPRERIQTHLSRVYWAVTDPKNAGCAYANVAVEIKEPDHPVRRIIEDHKEGYWNRLAALFKEAEMADPERLADYTFLLIEGARISAQCYGADGPAARVTRTLASIYADHARHPRRRTK